MYSAGAVWGIKLGQKMGAKLRQVLPLWARVLIGIISAGIFILLIWALAVRLTQIRRYQALQTTANAIFQAEQAYYARRGKFTANPDKLKISLPPMETTQYHQGGYTYVRGRKIETLEIYQAQTQSGDRWWISVGHGGSDPNALNVPPKLNIRLSRARGLPVEYSISHYFGKDLPEPFTLFQCNILHENKHKILFYGNFCKSLGAAPTDSPLLWLFPAPPVSTETQT